MRISANSLSYWRVLRHWGNMATGRSYWHVPQPEGVLFVPGKLHGYFNDLRAKTIWAGRVDNCGLPLVRLNGYLQHFPVTIFQKGLGHWDAWLQSGRTDQKHYTEFERTVSWALRAQDNRGGWRQPGTGESSMSFYSAMSQGQGISVLCRAYSVDPKECYVSSAVRAAQVMLAPVHGGGTAHTEPEGIVLEEFPLHNPRTVLNGWIFALYGLYDLDVVVRETRLQRSLVSTVTALAKRLSRYDAGYWSYYDTGGTLSSPFYHHLHIAQLRAMQNTFADMSEVFRSAANRFESYLKSRTRQARAVVVKGFQKLRHPPVVVVE